MRSYKTLAFLSLMFILLSNITSSLAVTKTLKGGNSRNWNNNGAWIPSGVPTFSDDVLLAVSSTNLIIDENAICASFTIEAGYSGTISFIGAFSLTVIGNWTNDGEPELESGLIMISGNYTNNNSSIDVAITDFTLNGTSPQTIFSASTPANSKATFSYLVVSNSAGVMLLSDLGIETLINFYSGGYINPNGYTIYLNGSIYNGPLPVELSSFSATISDNSIRLKWRTETEVNNYGFEIQRSTNNDNWDVLGFVEGHGNSNSPKEYSFTDGGITSGKYSYRLKQIDTDGNFEYSKTIEIDLGSPQVFKLSQNYPNPFNPSTTIEYTVSQKSPINLTIYNSLGEIIKELVNEVKEPGVYTEEFDGQNLSSGTYIYRIQSEKFVSTKKMLLIK